MPYDFAHEAMACVNELFYRDGAAPKPLERKDAEYVVETIERYLREAYTQDRIMEPHRVMTPEEYAAMDLKGWHFACKNVDRFGGVGVCYIADQWQPIDTAPKDGTRIFLFDAQHAPELDRVIGHWYRHPSVEGWITDEIDCNDYDFSPTRWMPLPAQPTSQSSGFR